MENSVFSRLCPRFLPFFRPVGKGAMAWLAGFLSLWFYTAPAASQEWLYTVRPGDNLWDITVTHLTHIRFSKHLQKLNKIDDPWHILPGTRLRIPLKWVRLEPATAKVVKVRGQATVVRADHQQGIALEPGMGLKTGDRLITGDQASASIEFGDGSRMLVEPDSELSFDLLRAYSRSGFVDTRVRLKRGHTEHKVVPRSGANAPRYEIITPAATSAVRGTTYRMDAAVSGDSSATEVLGGSVDVRSAGQVRSVPEGFGLRTQRNTVLGAPSALLAAPRLDGLPLAFDRVPLQFMLPSIDGAVAYRVQIADTEEFQALRYDAVLDVPRARGIDLPDGRYVMRLRGVDAKGLQGLDGYHTFEIDARPQPPVLVAPPAEARLSDDRVEFSWARPKNASTFHLQVSRQPSFEELLIDQRELPDNQFVTPQGLEPGTYYWRVATRDQQGEQGPFGDPQHFKRLSDPPTLQAPAIDENELVFRWSRGLPGDSYDFQLASDAGFDEIVARARVSEPTHTLARPPSGAYYLRVRTIDETGIVGPYGTTQRIDVPPGSFWPLVIPVLFVLIFL